MFLKELKVNDVINEELQRIELEKIQSEVQDEFLSRKEYYLREQLKAIQKELGEEGSGIELKKFKKRLKSKNAKRCRKDC